MGGWVAGILAGMVFLPVLGILNTCVVIAIFKLSSLILLLATKRNIPSDNIQ
jgi:spermidine synthase